MRLVRRRALVVGAGIAGLAAALRLRSDGWDVVVVERASELRGGDYVVSFGGAGHRVAERWGILKRLAARRTSPLALSYLDASGRRLAAMDLDAQRGVADDRSIALFRSTIVEVLHEAVRDDVEIRFATSVESIVEEPDSVSVRLTDGSVAEVDLLIGADGVHSRVRSLLWGPEQLFRHDLGHLVAIALTDAVPREVRPGNRASVSLAGRTFSIINPAESRPGAFFLLRSDDPAADLAAGAKTALRRHYGDLGWVVPELLDAVDRSDSIYFDRVSQIRTRRWGRGRVVLLGDAAWCVSLFAGYGASLAVSGADSLGDALAEAPLPSALSTWERRLRPAVQFRQRKGRRSAMLFVPPNQVALLARTQLLRLSGHPFARWWAGRAIRGLVRGP